MDQAKNFAKATVSQGYDDTATSIVLSAGEGARFPAVPFNAVWWNATDFPDPADDSLKEIVRVTARSTDTLTITRGQEGTVASTKDSEGKVYRLAAGLTAKVLNDEMPDFVGSGDDRTMQSAGLISLVGTGVVFWGPLGSDQTVSATTLGSVTHKLAINDENGDLVGYLPLYGSIT